jgi:ABC-type branched-subunit amino acid transport system ATPase component
VVPILRLDRLRVKVGIRRIVEALDLEVYENEAILIAGPNGSGKTTILNAIAGLEPARVESGTILIAGENVTNLPPHERARRGVAYLKQRHNVFADLSVGENLRIALGEEGLDRFRQVCPNWLPSLPLQKRVSLLSGGQKQRLAWAMTTLRPSRLLLADEPEAGMSDALPWPTDRAVLVVSHSEPLEALSQ